MDDLVVARTSGVVMIDRRRHTIRRGVTIARAGHPIVAANPRLWQPLRVHYDLTGVEQATAAPGELRELHPAEIGPDLGEAGGHADGSVRVSRPPTSGPGSGVDAWRRYAAEVTGTPAEEWAGKNREDIIKSLDGVASGE